MSYENPSDDFTPFELRQYRRELWRVFLWSIPQQLMLTLFALTVGVIAFPIMAVVVAWQEAWAKADLKAAYRVKGRRANIFTPATDESGLYGAEVSR